MAGAKGTERKSMSRVNLEGERYRAPKASSQDKSGTLHLRCRSCGLEWEPAYYQEGCPLRELETVFLSENWFLVPGEATG